MAGSQHHIIKNQILEFSFPPGSDPYALQMEVRRIYYERILPRLDTLFSEYAPEDALIRIPDLDIDLGSLRPGELEQQILARMEVALRRELARHLAGKKPGRQDPGSDTVAPRQAARSALEHFLLHGALPWSARREKEFSPEAVLRLSLEEAPGALLQILRGTGNYPAVRRRLLHHFSMPLKARLFALLAREDMPLLAGWLGETFLLKADRGIPSTPELMDLLRHFPDRGLPVLAEWEAAGELRAALSAKFPDKLFARVVGHWLKGKEQAILDLALEMTTLVRQDREVFRGDRQPGGKALREAIRIHARGNLVRAAFEGQTPEAVRWMHELILVLSGMGGQRPADLLGKLRSAVAAMDPQPQLLPRVLTGTGPVRANENAVPTRQEPGAWPETSVGTEEEISARQTGKDRKTLHRDDPGETPQDQPEGLSATPPPVQESETRQNELRETSGKDIPPPENETQDEAGTLKKESPSTEFTREREEAKQPGLEGPYPDESEEEKSLLRETLPPPAPDEHGPSPEITGTALSKKEPPHETEITAEDQQVVSRLENPIEQQKSNPIPEPDPRIPAFPEQPETPGSKQNIISPDQAEPIENKRIPPSPQDKTPSPSDLGMSPEEVNDIRRRFAEFRRSFMEGRLPGQTSPRTPHGRRASSPPPLWRVDTGAEYYVQNAGLVLLHPFISPFFKGLGLLDGKSFVDESARERAVHLLQCLASGLDSPDPEFDLMLNKLLCGLDPESPLDMDFKATAHEMQEAEILLETVIGHWKALKKVSVQGFRGTFLIREGKLRKKDMGWEVTVAPATMDILIERLPWGYSTIKMPWLHEFIYVNW